MALRNYQYYYNHYRLHDGIGLETPIAYSTIRARGLIFPTTNESAQLLVLAFELRMFYIDKSRMSVDSQKY